MKSSKQPASKPTSQNAREDEDFFDENKLEKATQESSINTSVSSTVAEKKKKIAQFGREKKHLE